MNQAKNTILVTWDFTRMSENALLHAIKLSRNFENNIRLVHVIKSLENGALAEAEGKLKTEIKRIQDEYKILCESVVLQGNLFSAITNYLREGDAIMVIMGTHGIKGLQKYFGSKALKVIVGSEVPYIVVHDKPANMDRISNILFPIDFKSENKEKLQWAIYLGKYFNCKVHLFKAPVTDSSLVKKVNVNLNFAIRFLIQNNLDYEIHTAKKYGSFGKEMISFAKEIEADLIMITTTKHITFLDYLFGASEQYIIDNQSGIPVMCVNPKATFAKMGQFMFGR
ncbi:MAG: universal stress protein [Bacteroidales bacterium]|nr:universal stress protein [Bacteroidales bacterium]